MFDTGGGNDTQFGLDFGGGLKPTIGDRLAARFDLGLARMFESDDRLAHWDLGVSAGISFFTK
jgi:hypothetical protein